MGSGPGAGLEAEVGWGMEEEDEEEEEERRGGGEEEGEEGEEGRRRGKRGTINLFRGWRETVELTAVCVSHHSTVVLITSAWLGL